MTMIRRATTAALLTLSLLLALLPLRAQAVGQGAVAPEIGLPDRSGKLVKIADLKGRVVIVDFWASWCAPCREELPVLDALYRKYRDKGLVVVAVGQDKEPENLAKFLRASPLSFPVVHDAKGAVAARYEPPKMPSSYVVDRKGLIRHLHAGFKASDKSALERELKQLLSEK
jgi:cytochrome c biogenesis protein CcmG, thiol:disulfide interchange protein DsbE